MKLETVVGTTDLMISSVCFDSRKAEQGCLFVAISGTQTDGNLFVQQAIEKGAIAIITEQLPQKLVEGIGYMIVKNASIALAVIANNFFDNPSEKIKLVGVTGTNGKTTIVSLLFQLMLNMNQKVGMLSTIHNKINQQVLESTHTTGDALQIHQLLDRMVKEGCTYCFMEVSSHAIDQNRIFGLSFDMLVFTNITHDHLDYHKTFNQYIQAKKKGFDQLSESACALVNIDDKHGMEMLKNTKAKKFTYSLKSMSDFKCKILETHFDGTLLNIQNQEVWSNLIGEFNAYNLLAVYAVAKLLHLDHQDILTGISLMQSAEGRFQTIRSNNNITAIVDYAHTPDALKNVLDTINKIRSGNEQLITVVGCGGDRDQSKRPKMASIAADCSTKVILTSDNPRSENPKDIILQMAKGLDPIQKKKCLEIIDRKQAIRTAYMLAKENDIILLAGKGHEKYQEINGIKHPFDDVQELTEILNQTQE